MNIVMLDSGQLTGEVDFPEVDLDKFGWQQFVSLDENEVEERCWRADIIISTNTPVTAKVIDEAYKLRLIIAAGDKTDHIDHAAAEARNIEVMNVSGLTGDDPQRTEAICNQVVAKINHWLKGQKD
jgi:lactate dehydrogenase-like 2-hydroxyacid dehydrogenase